MRRELNAFGRLRQVLVYTIHLGWDPKWTRVLSSNLSPLLRGERKPETQSLPVPATVATTDECTIRSKYK